MSQPRKPLVDDRSLRYITYEHVQVTPKGQKHISAVPRTMIGLRVIKNLALKTRIRVRASL